MGSIYDTFAAAISYKGWQSIELLSVVPISVAFFQFHTSELVINLHVDPYYERHQTAVLLTHVLAEEIPVDGLNSPLGLGRGCLGVIFN